MAHPFATEGSFAVNRSVMASGGSTVLDEYEWETLPEMQVARCYSVAAYHEGKLYVFGEQSSLNFAENSKRS